MPKTIFADVVSEIANARRKTGPRTWLSMLPPTLQKELVAIKKSWKEGELTVQKYALARAVRSSVIKHGHACVNTAGVVRWLNED